MEHQVAGVDRCESETPGKQGPVNRVVLLILQAVTGSRLALVLLLVLPTASCRPPDAGPASSEAVVRSVTNVPLVPEISINEIMVGQVDHAAHEILRLSLENNPRLTIGAWQELEHFAIQLISSTSAITMGGAGVNDAMWVAQTDWRGYTVDLNEASSLALAAVRNQDLPALLEAGEAIRASCDDCHRQYKPEVPTEGFYRVH